MAGGPTNRAMSAVQLGKNLVRDVHFSVDHRRSPVLVPSDLRSAAVSDRRV